MSYTHWGNGEPNNANGEEQCVQMNRHQGTLNTNGQTCSLFLVRCTEANHSVRLLQVYGTTPTVAERQDTSVGSAPGTSTPTLHPHSPGRETVPKVCFPNVIRLQHLWFKCEKNTGSRALAHSLFYTQVHVAFTRFTSFQVGCVSRTSASCSKGRKTISKPTGLMRGVGAESREETWLLLTTSMRTVSCSRDN